MPIPLPPPDPDPIFAPAVAGLLTIVLVPFIAFAIRVAPHAALALALELFIGNRFTASIRSCRLICCG